MTNSEDSTDSMRNDDYMTPDAIAAYRPFSNIPSEEQGREVDRARTRMEVAGVWAPNQVLGRRTPIGCVALEITQRCNLDCTLCYLSEHSESTKDIPMEEVFRRVDLQRCIDGLNDASWCHLRGRRRVILLSRAADARRQVHALDATLPALVAGQPRRVGIQADGKEPLLEVRVRLRVYREVSDPHPGTGLRHGAHRELHRETIPPGRKLSHVDRVEGESYAVVAIGKENGLLIVDGAHNLRKEGCGRNGGEFVPVVSRDQDSSSSETAEP